MESFTACVVSVVFTNMLMNLYSYHIAHLLKQDDNYWLSVAEILGFICSCV